MLGNYEDLISVQLDACSQFSNRPLFGAKQQAGWQWTTYDDFRKLVGRCRAGLAGLGVKDGDTVAIVSRNSLEWAVACYATYGLGATFVPMYEAQLESEIRYILEDSASKIVIASTPRVYDALRRVQREVPSLERVIGVALEEGHPDAFSTLLDTGGEDDGPPRTPSPDSIAGLVYTSGTTGKPKGVLLSHRNLASNLNAIRAAFPISPEERTLSVLPWAHAFGQTCELHYVISSGASTAINDELAHLEMNLAEVRPTVFIAVPRILNALYEAVNERIDAASPLVQRVFADGTHAATKLHRGEPLSLKERIELFVDDRTVYAKVRKQLGGRLKFIVSGSASLSADVAEFIDALGIPVYEGYGLSETSPAVSTNCPGRTKAGTVGRPLPGVRIEVDRSVTGDALVGELIVYGPNVMRGYKKRPEETAQALTPSGGLRTGDLGYLDEDGYLHVVGRIKEQYKLDSGKYVVPGPIEEQLSLSPYIASIMIYGENRPYNVAVLAPNRAAIERWARSRAIDGATALASKPVLDLLHTEILHHSRGLRSYEVPRRFILAREEFATENGLLTPTLKVKRQNVLALYRAELEALYERLDAAPLRT
ncbi:MAG TPA: long-chain fatty acid--CoA ligase [Polyangiaceae bacterium]|nr:long-chain fatty acid--CoA ligase [Polyangiaceae bacterium]